MSFERNIEAAKNRGQVNREREAARRAFQAKRIGRAEYSRVQRAASHWKAPKSSMWGW